MTTAKDKYAEPDVYVCLGCGKPYSSNSDSLDGSIADAPSVGFISEFELALLKCSNCGYEMKLSIYKTEPIRHTYCMNCNKAVYWARVVERGSEAS